MKGIISKKNFQSTGCLALWPAGTCFLLPLRQWFPCCQDQVPTWLLRSAGHWSVHVLCSCYGQWDWRDSCSQGASVWWNAKTHRSHPWEGMKRLRSEGGRRRVVYKKMWESLCEEVSFAPKLHVEKEPAGGWGGWRERAPQAKNRACRLPLRQDAAVHPHTDTAALPLKLRAQGVRLPLTPHTPASESLCPLVKMQMPQFHPRSVDSES